MKAFAHLESDKRHGGDDFYTDIYPSELQVMMCGEGTIYPVIVRESKDGEEHTHICWQDTDTDDFCMIFRDIVLLGVCFPYGIKASVEAGQGRVCNVIVELDESN